MFLLLYIHSFSPYIYLLFPSTSIPPNSYKHFHINLFPPSILANSPAIGPIAGGFITQRTTWRWAFYATSIADALIQLSGLFFLRETYHPKLLHAKAAKLRLSTGNMALHTEYEHAERTLTYILRTNLQRPFRLIGTQAIVQVLALYMAYLYGLLYLVLATFPALWATRYHQSIAIGGLNYISLGLGFFFGTQVCAPLNDRVYCALRARNAGVGRPEFRLPLMVPASVLVPVGLLVYGWAAEYEAHWAWPNLGAGLFAAGLIVCFNCISTYLVDAYTRYASSAIGAATVLRSFAGFGFPLFVSLTSAALSFHFAPQRHEDSENGTKAKNTLHHSILSSP
jgi:MFS family permease